MPHIKIKDNFSQEDIIHLTGVLRNVQNGMRTVLETSIEKGYIVRNFRGWYFDVPYSYRGEVSVYICDNIRSHKTKSGVNQKFIALVIDVLLEGEFSLTHWLTKYHGVYVLTKEDFIKLQRTRIAWIDYLIELLNN